jgi:uncharacterized membrane protein YjgN (DUF898 family)
MSFLSSKANQIRFSFTAPIGVSIFIIIAITIDLVLLWSSLLLSGLVSFKDEEYKGQDSQFLNSRKGTKSSIKPNTFGEWKSANANIEQVN